MSDFEAAKNFFLQGLEFFSEEKFADAEVLFEKALQLVPGRASVLTNLGATKFRLGKLGEARDLALAAVRAETRNSEGFLILGLVELSNKNAPAALEYFDKALEADAASSEAWSNKGVALTALQRFDDALTGFDKAIALRPDDAYAWLNKGVTLHELRRFDQALAHYDKAIALKPAYAEAWSNKGVTLQEAQRLDAAVTNYRKATDLNPGYAKGWYNLGMVCDLLKKYDEASASFAQAIRLKPDLDLLIGQALYTRLKVCDWKNFDVQIENLLSRLRQGKLVATSFAVLAISRDEEVNARAAQIWVKERCPAGQQPVKWTRTREKAGKITLGYFSSDFQNHAISYLMAGMLESHDKSRFELIAFSFGPGKNDETRKRVAAAFDRFIDIRDKSDPEVAQLARQLGVDIAVDVNGFTQYARSGIFACRAAPVQVNYLGYPGTMGADYMDYIIADPMVIPDANRSSFAEQVVYLPHCYQPNDSRRQIADKRFTRTELGLPEEGFVYCCFNNNHKINPATFDSWMKILGAVEGSVLWLFEDNPTAADNLRNEAVKRGISADRLVFARVMPLPEHLARHRAADLFLDTLPYNAHTTASDALWAGVPLLTLIGNTFAGRVAASLLKAVNLPELITTTREGYETMAIELANKPAELLRVKNKLAANRLTAPLFDTALYAKHIEAAYIQMHDRYVQGLKPECLYINSSIDSA